MMMQLHRSRMLKTVLPSARMDEEDELLVLDVE
jgi:hypothetical protein